MNSAYEQWGSISKDILNRDEGTINYIICGKWDKGVIKGNHEEKLSGNMNVLEKSFP